MNPPRALFLSLLLLIGVSPTLAETAEPFSSLASMPVKEVTVFKDGHAFVIHQGRMPTDTHGDVLLDNLPTPVLGTFWPYSADKNAKLTAVVASQRRLAIPRTALTLREMIEANVGANVRITETNNTVYQATIVAVPSLTADEVDRKGADPAMAGGSTDSTKPIPQPGGIVVVKTEIGTKVMPIDQIRDITLLGDMKSTAMTEEYRPLLDLKLDWRGGSAGKSADVGFMYLQDGLRWIPSYKVRIDGAGNATVSLQATLVNDLTDLDDVTANLVIGVPSFAFAGMTDPIAIQQTMASLAPYYRKDTVFAQQFDNSLVSNVAYEAARSDAAPSAPSPSPEVSSSEKNEDLFVFNVQHVTLRRGQRMVLPIAEFPLIYKDVYTLDLPVAPPAEVRQYVNSGVQSELAAALRKPHVMHVIRLENKSAYPLTTAPALIMRGDSVLAQGRMTYTAIGASGDLTVTTASNVSATRKETETERQPNAQHWEGYDYGLVRMKGVLTVTNHDTHAVNLEVTRQVIGQVDTVGPGGVAEMLDMFGGDDDSSQSAIWSGLPDWWNHFNGLGRFTWKVTLPAAKSVDLGYTWHYLWR